MLTFFIRILAKSVGWWLVGCWYRYHEGRWAIRWRKLTLWWPAVLNFSGGASGAQMGSSHCPAAFIARCLSRRHGPVHPPLAQDTRTPLQHHPPCTPATALWSTGFWCEVSFSASQSLWKIKSSSGSRSRTQWKLKKSGFKCSYCIFGENHWIPGTSVYPSAIGDNTFSSNEDIPMKIKSSHVP